MTEESLESIKEMMAQLIGDCRRRDVAEPVRREAKMVAEREKQEKKREARERDFQLQMEKLQAYMERLTEIRKKLTADQSGESASGGLGNSNTSEDALVMTAAGKRLQFGHMERDSPVEESRKMQYSARRSRGSVEHLERPEESGGVDLRRARRCKISYWTQGALGLWSMRTWFLRESSWREAQKCRWMGYRWTPVLGRRPNRRRPWWW